jgi:hypothetical protein
MFISLRADYKGAKIITGSPIISGLYVRGLIFDLAGRVVEKNFCGAPFETYRIEMLKSSWPKDVERYVAIEVSMATNTPFILEQHRDVSVLQQRVYERYRGSKNAMFIIDCAKLAVALVLSAKSQHSDYTRAQFNAEYHGDFTSLSQARETDAALSRMRRNEINAAIVSGWQEPKPLHINCRSTIKEIEMKRIAITVGNHVLSLPFSTATLDLLLEADVLSFQFDSPDDFPDCHTKTFYHSDMKTEVTIIEQRDIKDNPNVISEAIQSTIEKLQAELDSYKSRATTL